MKEEIEGLKAKPAAPTATIESEHPRCDCELLVKRDKLLREEVEALKEEIRKTKPSFKIGMAIRLRYLEQAKEAVLQGPEAVNQMFIREGNQAAHSANGVADASLFTNGILERDDLLGNVFEGLYRQTQVEFLIWPELFRRTLDTTQL